MIVKSAAFVKSAVKPAQYPPADLPEIAFAGRSNVGKSSLINTLVNRRQLVKTSKTPGRTQLINFFRVNDAFMLVDLPGYGFARVPEPVRRKWGPMVETYLASRAVLRGVVLVLDIRRLPGPDEQTLLSWLARFHIPAIPVLTKADKLGRSQQAVRQGAIAQAMACRPDELVLFSAKSRQGKDALWRRLDGRLELTPGEDA